MASSRLATHQAPSTVGGVKFTWRSDTNTLEQVGGLNISYQEGPGSRQQRRHRSEKKKDRERLAQFPVSGNMAGIHSNSYRDSFTNLPKYVTMQDVKAVALGRMTTEGVSVSDLYDSPMVDEMIACSLKFFDCYFKIQDNNKPRPMMAIMLHLSEQSKEEVEREARDQEVLLEAHKQLSSVYGAVLLGYRSPDTHHLCGGKLRYSKTRKDKDFYEGLYQCLTYCACLTFEHADPDVIKTEMGRLFRSDSFNINQRVLSQKELEGKYPDYFKPKGLSDPNKGPSAAEYRRLRSKRSQFGKAIHQHSPMVDAMLSNPHHATNEVTSSGLLCFGIGIIGKSIRDYDLGSLKKLGEKEKKELELNETFSSRSPSVVSLRDGV